MDDKFGRHKSTRWVRASVPSYGDEWNDEDYNYGSGSESETEHIHADTNNVVAERFILPEDKQEDGNETSPEKNVNGLVLSIDKLDVESDKDSDNESNVLSEKSSKQETRPNLHDNQGGQIKQTVLTTTNNSILEPPTPVFNEKVKTSVPNTPISEQSFQSDADSIQHETDLRVGDISHLKDTSLGGYDDIIEEYPHDENENFDQESDEIDDKGSEDGREDLILSIDKRNFENSSDDSDKEEEEEEEAIPYYEKKLESHEHSEDNDDDYKYRNEEVDELEEDDKPNALDSFITDLQNSSYKEGDEEFLPPIDTNVSLPDFENNYSYYDYDYDEEENDNVTPIAPLSTSDEKDFHEKYVNELSGHKPSIRKPPQSDTLVDSSRRSSIRKPPTESLGDDESSFSGSSSKKSLPAVIEVPKLGEGSKAIPAAVDSPSYSTFGDAVDAYMSDRGSSLNTIIKLNESLSHSNGDNEVNDGDMTEGEDSSIERKEQPLPEEQTLMAPSPMESELHPVASSGSLSTGKLSYDPRSEFEPPSLPGVDKDLNRRDSTMSTNTFSMGAWKPNTNNFRDQFINDNDNESSFNFNLENESNSGYQKFTKNRGASDNMSFISTNSIPETVDIPLPSIHEDGSEEGADDTFSSENNNSAETSQGLGISQVGTNSDSILDDKEYSNKFQEQLSSLETLPKANSNNKQRYTSLLSPVDDDESLRNISQTESSGTFGSSSIAPSILISNQGDKNQISHTRNTSGTSSATFSSKKFPPNAYPVFNWGSIMKASQPIDRIKLLKEAQEKEYNYDSGLQIWLNETLTKSDNASNIHIGRIASQAYQNAAHNDLRRHTSIRSRVSSVRDKVETSGMHASSLGKKIFSRSRKLMRST